MRSHHGALGIAILLAAFTPVAAKADVTIANSSFESPDATSSMYSTGNGFQQGYMALGGSFSDGWTFVNGGGVAHNGSAFGEPAAPDGVQVGILQSGAPTSISQELTGFTVGASYVFNFYEAARNYGGGANPFTVTFGGDLLGTFTPGSTAFQAVTTSAFTASSTSGLLTFAGVGSPSGADVTSFIDAVTITQTADAAPAPLAGAGLLSFFGVGGMAARRRAKRFLSVIFAKRIAPPEHGFYSLAIS